MKIHLVQSIVVLIMVSVMTSCTGEASTARQRIIIQKEVSMEQAKRRVKRAKPVSKNGIRYEEIRGARARGFKQEGGVIAAIDEATGSERWTLVVYETAYDPQEEQDVQDVFITKFSINWRGTVLTVVNEKKETFEIDLSNRRVNRK